MKQYQDLLKDILNKGAWKEPARANMPKTISLFGTRMEFDMKDGFPLLTTKRMYTKAIVTELLWFLKGDTNIKYLVDNGCNIWNQDAYRWYLKKIEEQNLSRGISFDLFVNYIKNAKDYKELMYDSRKNNNMENPLVPDYYVLGDLGKVYGKQWRNQGGVDQTQSVIDKLKSDPMGRYAIIDAWNPSDFNEMALPPCHLLYQFNCRERSFLDRAIEYEKRTGITMHPDDQCHEFLDKWNIPRHYLDLQMYQRSCDTFLGVPFNIASASLLLHLIAKVTNTIPSKFVWVGGDTHIYENHLNQIGEQLNRDPLDLCTLNINKQINSIEDLENLKPEDIVFIDYDSFPPIKGELKTGL
jgi:thymidylate synthase